jgi:negative regulator of flagellin synthesis FlgM
MVNDINNINAPQPGKPRNSGSDAVDNSLTRSGSNNANASVSSSNTADTVQLSTQAQELSRIKRDLQTLPEIDEARVSQVRESIDNGTYVIDADRIAAQILSDEQNFSI